MTRVKRGNIARKRRKKILNLTQGFRGSSSSLFRTSNQQKMKALRSSYRDRNQRKRQFRSVWITRMNAAVRFYGVNYSQFLYGLKKSNIFLNRKMLSQLAIRDTPSFQKLIESF
jgi:large subunit ribosomal protein L20